VLFYVKWSYFPFLVCLVLLQIYSIKDCYEYGIFLCHLLNELVKTVYLNIFLYKDTFSHKQINYKYL